MTTNIELFCTGAAAISNVNGTLTGGAVGVKVKVYFDDSWNGLTAKLHVSCGGVDREMYLDDNKEADIPWECMIGGELLKLGVDGWDSSWTLRIPTEWANCGYVKNSTEGSTEPPATPDLTMQILAIVENSRKNMEAFEAEMRRAYGSIPNDVIDAAIAGMN